MKVSGLLWMLVLLCGCGISMERVPSSSEIQNSRVWSQFLIDSDDIRGSYQNLDVDCVVFSYSTRVQSADAFWEKLTSALKGKSWKEIDPTGSVRRFERRFAKGKAEGERTDMATFSSAEQTCVSYMQGRVVVAWVQADSSKEETSFAETSEARFADKNVWPKFRALTK